MWIVPFGSGCIKAILLPVSSKYFYYPDDNIIKYQSQSYLWKTTNYRNYVLQIFETYIFFLINFIDKLNNIQRDIKLTVNSTFCTSCKTRDMSEEN